MMDKLRPLTQEQRQAARASAREAVVRSIGLRPAREQFAHHTVSKYPPIVTRLISLLCIILLSAAFTPSAIRLYVIGSQTFGQAVDNGPAKTAVGLATVLCAEVGQVVFSLALATLGTSQSSRRLLHISMALATGVALTGNIQTSLPGHTDSPFAWLEAVIPPLLVLSTAYVLKEQILSAIETRHANEISYQEVLGKWQRATGDPEAHPQWAQCYANALRDAMWKGNHRRRETLNQMTQNDWYAAVTREMQADAWYQEPLSDEKTRLLPALPQGALGVGRNGSGHSPKVSVAAE
jgi:hypothetical protein